MAARVPDRRQAVTVETIVSQVDDDAIRARYGPEILAAWDAEIERQRKLRGAMPVAVAKRLQRDAVARRARREAKEIADALAAADELARQLRASAAARRQKRQRD